MNSPNIFHRLLLFLFSFLILIVVGFLLVLNVPGDAVNNVIGNDQLRAVDKNILTQEYIKTYERLELNQPAFYFSWSSRAVPDSFKYLPFKNQSDLLIKISNESGQPELCYQFTKKIYPGKQQQTFLEHPNPERRNIIEKLKTASSLSDIHSIKSQYKSVIVDDLDLNNLFRLFERIDSEKKVWMKWIPAIHFNKSNRFHSWMFGENGLIHGNFGRSFATGASINKIIYTPLLITISLSFACILFSALISIPTAIFLVKYENYFVAKIIRNSFLFLQAIPSFWLATLLLLIFANPEVFNWFPANGVVYPSSYQSSGMNWEHFVLVVSSFVLPIIAYSAEPIAFFTRLLYAGIQQQFKEDYILTARAKGLSENVVLWKHSLRLAIIPLISIMFSNFPVMISGSIILESVFNIHGMGSVIKQALSTQDFPVLNASFLLIGFIAVLTFALGDLALFKIDPLLKSNNRMSSEI